MGMDMYKSAWQNRPPGDTILHGGEHLSRSVRFLRASAIRDLQKSEEVSRLVFGVLFALVAVGATSALMTAGGARIASWLLASALLADSFAGFLLLASRFRERGTVTMLEYVSRELRHLQKRLRFERTFHRLLVALGGITLLVFYFTPAPAGAREGAYEVLGRMVMLTGFLVLAWRRAKSKSGETRRELESYLKEFGD